MKRFVLTLPLLLSVFAVQATPCLAGGLSFVEKAQKAARAARAAEAGGAVKTAAAAKKVETGQRAYAFTRFGEVRLLTAEEFAKLPAGTKLYSPNLNGRKAHEAFVVGRDHFDMTPSSDGFLQYGVLDRSEEAVEGAFVAANAQRAAELAAQRSKLDQLLKEIGVPKAPEAAARASERLSVKTAPTGAEAASGNSGGASRASSITSP